MTFPISETPQSESFGEMTVRPRSTVPTASFLILPAAPSPVSPLKNSLTHILRVSRTDKPLNHYKRKRCAFWHNAFFSLSFLKVYEFHLNSSVLAQNLPISTWVSSTNPMPSFLSSCTWMFSPPTANADDTRPSLFTTR